MKKQSEVFNIVSEPSTILMVEWLDASHQSGPIDITELSGEHIIRSVGWLIQETRERVTLAQDFCVSIDSYREVLHIPKKYILKEERYNCDLP